MTKKQQDIVNRYEKSTARCLSDVYRNYSTVKKTSFEDIQHEMIQAGGEKLRIISYNCNFYTCAYTIYGVSSRYIVYHTHTKKEIIEIN